MLNNNQKLELTEILLMIGFNRIYSGKTHLQYVSRYDDNTMDIRIVMTAAMLFMTVTLNGNILLQRPIHNFANLKQIINKFFDDYIREQRALEYQKELDYQKELEQQKQQAEPEEQKEPEQTDPVSSAED